MKYWLKLPQRTTLIVLSLLALMSCNPSTEVSHTLLPTGEGKLEVTGGNIWYKVSGQGTGTPLVLLHGGPGFSSFYLKPMDALGTFRQVIRYDQLGSGKSDGISDTSLFTIGNFVSQLEALRIHLNIEKWHVLGHSWGTILAYEYYRKYPGHVASLIFGSPCLDAGLWEKSTTELLGNLPDSLQQAVHQADATGNYDDPMYEEAINSFYGTYVLSENPPAADLDSLFALANMEIYNYMWGPSEFSLTGTLRGYTVMDFLPDIDVPVLFTVGEFDEIQPRYTEQMAAEIPNATVEVLDNAMHLTMWSAPEKNNEVVEKFLKTADGKE